jgi:hypothetical protein
MDLVSLNAANSSDAFFLAGRGTVMYLREAVGGGVVLGFLGLLAFVNGCSPRIEPKEPPLGHARIQRAASVCREFVVSQKRQPSNVDELKAWAKKLPKTQLTYMGIENLDEPSFRRAISSLM